MKSKSRHHIDTCQCNGPAQRRLFPEPLRADSLTPSHLCRIGPGPGGSRSVSGRKPGDHRTPDKIHSEPHRHPGPASDPGRRCTPKSARCRKSRSTFATSYIFMRSSHSGRPSRKCSRTNDEAQQSPRPKTEALLPCEITRGTRALYVRALPIITLAFPRGDVSGRGCLRFCPY